VRGRLVPKGLGAYSILWSVLLSRKIFPNSLLLLIYDHSKRIRAEGSVIAECKGHRSGLRRGRFISAAGGKFFRLRQFLF
jgi:hypothetical protein